MRACEEVGPYYSHFMAWRLGTWFGDEWFAFLEELLVASSGIPGWDARRFLDGCDHRAFWGFIWELQVAHWLVHSNEGEVTWLSTGPDLLFEGSESELYVECTTYQKSYALERFISELLNHIDPHLAIQHTPLTIFSLPKNGEVDAFLDDLLRPLIDNKHLAQVAAEATVRSPRRLRVPEGVNNLYLLYEADNPEEIDVDQPWATTGSPSDFLNIAWKEVLDNKRESNQLELKRPNLVAINFLLGDYQLASILRDTEPTLDFGSTFDAILISACGIDKVPSSHNSRIHTRGLTLPVSLES